MFVVALDGPATTCERPNLSEIECKIGCCSSLSRSMLKSPMSSRDLAQDGGSSSRVASRMARTDCVDEGGW